MNEDFSIDDIINIALASRYVDCAIEKEDYACAKKIYNKVIDDSSITGTTNDLHNLSVDFYTIDDYESALGIAERGLSIFSNNVNLIADVLLYSTCLGMYDKADQMYKKLKKLSKGVWTWRAFSFSIDYLLTAPEWAQEIETIENLIDEAVSLSQEYQKYFPNDDKSYSKEYDLLNFKARVYKSLGKQDWAKYEEDAILALRKCLSNPASCASDTSIKYAKLCLEAGNTNAAIEACEEILNNYSPNIKIEKVLFIRAISKLRELSTSRTMEASSNFNTANDIYVDLLTVLKLSNDERTINSVREAFYMWSNLSGQELPDEIE